MRTIRERFKRSICERPGWGISLAVLAAGSSLRAQPDYGPAHWVPPTGCTKWYTTGNGPDFCVIHDMEGYYWTSISYLNNCSVSASVHYLVNGLQNGSDSLGHRENRPDDPVAGDITQSVREQHWAWHARCWNRWMFGTEHEGFVSTPVWYSEEMYRASAALHRHLCDTYGIPKDRNHIIGHNEWQNAAWRTWMTNNYPSIDPTCNTHTDPGQYWNWAHFMSLITNTGPAITGQPQDQLVYPGSNATFTVTANGSGPLAYQWRLNTVDVAGATASAYTRTNAQLNDIGSYSVVVTDANGSVTSSDAVLAVIAPPLLTRPLQAQTVFLGGSATLAVGILGSSPLNYQWRLNGRDLPDATGGSFTIVSAQKTNAGLYSVTVSNPYGAAPTSEALVTVIRMGVWGDDSWGQMALVPPETNLIAIAAGAWHSLALRADGTVLAWGDDFNGQCDVPPQLADALAIAAGGYHSLAIRADGTVLAWGASEDGQTNVPAKLGKTIAIAAGAWHSLALRRDGTVVAWGNNACGQTNVPLGLAGVVAIAAGGNHSLALRADGSVVAWGENTDSQGNFTGQSTVPWGLSNAIALAGGEYHSLALLTDGSVVAWGDNSEGQCSVPAGLSGVVALAAGGAHSLALRQDGTVAAWGANWSGQCGLAGNLSDVIGLSAGANHSLVLVEGTLPGARLLSPWRQGSRFSAVAQTVNRKNYALDHKNYLDAPHWTPVCTNAGNGALTVLSDPGASTAHRFYRIRQW